MIDKSLPADEKLNKSDALFLVGEEIRESLNSSPKVIREYTSHLGKASGKLFRARSLIACSQDDEGSVPRRAVTAAAAIEIFHLATLVHDDVIDEASIRRGIPTLNEKYGVRTAVICGDYLLSMALRMISSVFQNDNVPEIKMPDLLGRLCLGELSQHINNGNFSLSAFRYLKIISGKTAALFEISFYMGAYLSGSSQSSKIARVGRYMGMIFQLTDDCMDYEASEQKARKPVLSDFEQKVITLPLIHAIRKSTDIRKKALKGELDINTVNEAVRTTGGLRFTRAIARRYQEKAMAILDSLNLGNLKRNDISFLVESSYRTF